MPLEGNFDATGSKKTPIENSVTFYVDRGTVRDQVEVNLQDVNNLFEDLGGYNSQFSLGAMMTRMLTAHFGSEESEVKLPGSSLADESKDQQFDAFILASKHKRLLDNIGLSLEPVAFGGTLMGLGQAANETQMVINIKYRDNFIAFLTALEPVQIELTGVKGNLEKVPEILSQQIRGKYNLMEPQPEALELFQGMERIIEEYQRLGMTESVAQLENYNNHRTIGDLREYVAIERRGLFSPPGQFFGPADWQRDMSPTVLEARWNETLEVLEKTKQNPKAGALYEQLLAHLSVCVNSALENLQTLDYIPSEDKAVDQRILERAKARLKNLG